MLMMKVAVSKMSVAVDDAVVDDVQATACGYKYVIAGDLEC